MKLTSARGKLGAIVRRTTAAARRTYDDAMMVLILILLHNPNTTNPSIALLRQHPLLVLR